MTPSIRFSFHDHYDLCDIIIEESGKHAEYGSLRTKKVNLRDYEDPQIVYQVKIPCAKVFGQDYMLCCGMDAIKGYKHPEYQELILTPMNDDEETETDLQLRLFE